MRSVDLTKKPSRLTVLSYGHTRAGKTRWSATWPRPLVLAEASEGGWTTIQNMEKSDFYEPDRPPMVWAIEKGTDMLAAITEARPLIERGDVRTVVVDSISFYADLYRSHLIAIEGDKDGRQIYGKLGDHLQYLREKVHGLHPKVNVVWLALDRPGDKETPLGGPLIPGQAAQKFAAGCDFILYHNKFKSGSDWQYEIRTQQFGTFVAGGRDMGFLPDPLATFEKRAKDDGSEEEILVPGNSYRVLARALALPAIDFNEPMRGDVAASTGASAPSKSAAPASPPKSTVILPKK